MIPKQIHTRFSFETYDILVNQQYWGMKLIKLVERFLSEPSEVRFEEARSLLEAFGFSDVRSKGSHQTFRNDRGQVQVIPKSSGQQVKRTYVKQIVRSLNLKEWYADQTGES